MNKDNNASAKTIPAVSFLQVTLVTLFGCGFFSVTSPTPASSLVVIAGSVMLAAVLYVWLALLVRLFALFLPFPTRQQRILAAALTFIVMFLALMQSIGELSWRDAFVAIPLVIILYAYATYATHGRPAHAR